MNELLSNAFFVRVADLEMEGRDETRVSLEQLREWSTKAFVLEETVEQLRRVIDNNHDSLSKRIRAHASEQVALFSRWAYEAAELERGQTK